MEEIKKVMRQAKLIFADNIVGVMDQSGVIIASTDQNLEGTVDSTIRAVMKSNDLFSATADRTYMKVKAGEQIKNVIFIDSVDSDIRMNLMLLGEWIKAAVKDRGSDAERELFAKNVLLENELPGDIPLKAKNYGIDYALPRLVMVVRTAVEDTEEALVILRSLYSDPDVGSAMAMDEKTIILILNADCDDRDEFVSNAANGALDCLTNEGVSARIGVGSVVSHYHNISKSYRDAMQSLKIGNIFEKKQQVTRYDKLGIGRIIYQLPPTLCQMFIDEVFPDGAYDSLDEDTLATIQCFFDNNLNGSETSRELFVHRNTLVYRLDKVQKNTGLNLRSFDDAVLFKIASMVRQYLNYTDDGKSDNQIR